jgi:hypothetical protein
MACGALTAAFISAEILAFPRAGWPQARGKSKNNAPQALRLITGRTQATQRG